MALVLPARTAFPDARPDAECMPGQVVTDENVEDIVEGQHYCTAYFGRMLVPGMRWPAGRISVATHPAAPIRVLEFVDVPRIHMTSAQWRIRAQRVGGAAAGTVRVNFPDVPAFADIAVPVGAAAYYTANVAINRANLVTRIQVLLRDGGAGADLINLLEFGCWDMDLTAAGLP